MTRQRARARAHDLEPLRAAIHGRRAELLPPAYDELGLERRERETYLDRALDALQAIKCEAAQRLEAAQRVSQLDERISARAAWLARGRELGLRSANAPDPWSMSMTDAIDRGIAAARAAGLDAEDLRTAIVTVALERGYTAREAAHIANVLALPPDAWPAAIEIPPATKAIDGERAAQRLQARLRADAQERYDAIGRELFGLRLALVDGEDRAWLMSQLEAAQRKQLHRLVALGDRRAARILRRDLHLNTPGKGQARMRA